MKSVCFENQCTGCNACVSICPKDAIKIEDSIFAYNAIIDESKCIDCKLCKKICPNQNIRKLLHPIDCKQGWARKEVRKLSSSGGAASAIMQSFIENGGYICSCCFEAGQFKFSIAKSKEEIRKFAGSKYVKSNPEQIYEKVKKILDANKKVLFIGLPCQSAAIQNYCLNHEKLYTIDLICHGTPSPKLLQKFVKETGYEWDTLRDIQFRKQELYGLYINGVKVSPRRVVDSYLIAFLREIDYTENCYSCRYATVERVSDITLGDAWGGLADGNPDGVSLVLSQTQKGQELVKKANLYLEKMDLNVAINANKQLYAPSQKHPGRNSFMVAINKGDTFHLATFKAVPGLMMKQSIKSGLIKMGLVKDFKEN